MPLRPAKWRDSAPSKASFPVRPAWLRALDVVLGADRHLRVRTAMAGLAGLLMLCCVAAMHIVARAGMADQGWVNVWTLFCVSGLVGVFALIRSGQSRRFRDPSLTLFQMLYAVACDAAAFVIAGPARGITLPILAVILMFGIFGLSTRQMVGVLFYSLAAFGAGGVLAELREELHQGPAMATAYAIMILVVLLSSTFLTTRVQATRQVLRRQKHDLAAALEHIRELATHDELTGLLNRRHMLELMRLEQRRVARSGHPLVLVQLDLDHFKAINDTHGHAAGDRALQAFAHAVKACVRDSDVLSRWGGEEFVLMLCNTRPDDASALLERVRLTVSALRLDPPGSQAIHLTVSIGLALHGAGETVEQTLERADRALYAAKAQGRDRVVWAPPA
ncbi:diguanylate cyclase (GGDEF) domain-containing protein [Paracidovorax valerianellae]|uniref:diguanylate cyclase n=2 Tax=Paracidovorax valerianellae TaxID=187868 RepID=A0A1G6RLF3_9BURK|nr:diguanylate cyclase (GGDEF) domain-containing protein [Paracidovorax valerianellae]